MSLVPRTLAKFQTDSSDMGTLCRYSKILPKGIKPTINTIFEMWPGGSEVSGFGMDVRSQTDVEKSMGQTHRHWVEHGTDPQALGRAWDRCTDTGRAWDRST